MKDKNSKLHQQNWLRMAGSGTSFATDKSEMLHLKGKKKKKRTDHVLQFFFIIRSSVIEQAV